MGTPSWVQFGAAYAEYPKGPIVPRQRIMSLRQRPEETEADVVRMGMAPRPFVLQSVIFGDTAVQVLTELDRWYAEVGHVHSLYMSDPCPIRGIGITLMSAQPNTSPKFIVNASNGASYMQHVTLVFADVANSNE